MAKEHRVSPCYVSQIVQKARRNEKFIEELVSERNTAEEKRRETGDAIEQMCKQEQFLESVAGVQESLEKDFDIEAKESKIREIMRTDLKMSYRRVKSVSWQANNNKNLILRQQFAKAFLDIDLEKKVILNVDETWLGMSDFRRMRWRPHHITNSVAQLQISPRVSMVAGLDTCGRIYLSLLQSNSNSSVMQLFFKHLFRTLDMERPAWRKNTVILLDNAPYHKSSRMLEFL